MTPFSNSSSNSTVTTPDNSQPDSNKNKETIRIKTIDQPSTTSTTPPQPTSQNQQPATEEASDTLAVESTQQVQVAQKDNSSVLDLSKVQSMIENQAVNQANVNPLTDNVKVHQQKTVVITLPAPVQGR